MRGISVEGVCFDYGREIILKDVHLKIEQNDFILLNGPNGAGKTTLISLILGFFKPSHGYISFHQVDFNRDITYLPQKGIFYSVPMKVVDVVASSFITPQSFLFAGYKKQKQAAWETLERLKLQDLGNREFISLSGGQAQKVLLARVLSNPKPFIFLDEPFSNMDEKSRDFMMSQLVSLKGKSGILMISHDMDLIADHPGRFCYLKQGQLKTYNNIRAMEISFFHDHTHMYHSRGHSSHE